MGHHKTDQHMHYENFRQIKIKRQSSFEEIITENFPNLREKMDIQIQEAQKTTNRIATERSISRHTIIK